MKPYCVITRPSDFIEGVHWRWLTKDERKGTKWKATLLVDVLILRETGLKHDYMCWQGGQVWMILKPEGVLMKRGYSWNFNTSAPDLWGKLASLPHDGLFQFSGCFYFPRAIIDRMWANNFYYSLCEKSVAWAYRFGLALGSWWCWGNQPLHGEFVEPLP